MIKKLKLEKEPINGFNLITKEELKYHILTFYYPYLKKEYKNNSKEWNDEFSREFFEIQIKDNHGLVSTIVYSINGSPPKGIGILIDVNSMHCKTGILIILGNRGKTSQPYPVIITN